MSPSETITQHRIASHDLDISVLEVGEAHDPAFIMVHGLRDSAHALLPMARELIAGGSRLRILLPELRGHGDSDHPSANAYALANFVMDLHAVYERFAPTGAALFGHSLGGHITTKFAAMFPERVPALILVEGLGPPHRPHEDDAELEVAAFREMLLHRLAPGHGRGRPIEDIDDVIARLRRNNPRLSADAAAGLAPHLVRHTEAGWRWAFDPRASSVFVGTSRAWNETFWRQVKAPTCIISGTLSHEYWGREMPAAQFSGHFAEGEMEARAGAFANHEHHWFDGSGHMVHYDEPDRLAETCRTFLEKHYV